MGALTLGQDAQWGKGNDSELGAYFDSFCQHIRIYLAELHH